MSTIKTALHWRYATKRYDSTHQVDESILDEILESIRLAPTSLGLQPFKAYVITDSEMKTQLSPACYNQPQIIESSVVVVFAAITELTTMDIEKHIHRIANTRQIPVESLDGFQKSITNFTGNKDQQQIKDWAAKQTYIALGFALLSAAQHQIDSTPMEGFNASEVDRILQLESQKLHATVILTLGKRSEANDTLAQAPKVRKNAEEMFVYL